jgi:hypothetical protein
MKTTSIILSATQVVIFEVYFVVVFSLGEAIRFILHDGCNSALTLATNHLLSSVFPSFLRD